MSVSNRAIIKMATFAELNIVYGPLQLAANTMRHAGAPDATQFSAAHSLPPQDIEHADSLKHYLLS